MKTLKEVEKDYILQALTALSWNKTKVAKTLGISVKTLYNKLHLYGLMSETTEVKLPIGNRIVPNSTNQVDTTSSNNAKSIFDT